MTVTAAWWLWQSDEAQFYRSARAELQAGTLTPGQAFQLVADDDAGGALGLPELYSDDRATLSFFAARDALASPDPAVRNTAPEALSRARTLLEASLASEPAQPFQWARLIYVLQLQGASPTEILDAIRLSIYFGPDVQKLLAWRIRLMGRMLPYGDQALENEIIRHVRTLADNGAARELLYCENIDLLSGIRDLLNDDGYFFGNIATEAALRSVKRRCGVSPPGLEPYPAPLPSDAVPGAPAAAGTPVAADGVPADGSQPPPPLAPPEESAGAIQTDGSALSGPEAPVTSGATRSPEELAAVQTLDRWARAWSERDLSAYLAAYAQSGSPVAGLSRQDWESDRRERLALPGPIEVTLSDVSITRVDDETLIATFVQNYRSPRITSSTSKELVLRRDGPSWVIVSERPI